MARCGGQVGFQVFTAGLTLRRIEDAELVVRACYWSSMKAGGQHAGYKVGEGRDAVHEDPEARQCLRGLDHAVEGKRQREEHRGDGPGCAFVLW